MFHEFTSPAGDELRISTSGDGARLQWFDARWGEWMDQHPKQWPAVLFGEIVRLLEILEEAGKLEELEELSEKDRAGLLPTLHDRVCAQDEDEEDGTDELMEESVNE